jgi:hypothetical protein
MLLFPCCNFHTILPAFHLLHYFSHIAALALFLSCCSFCDAPYALPLSKMGLWKVVKRTDSYHLKIGQTWKK